MRMSILPVLGIGIYGLTGSASAQGAVSHAPPPPKVHRSTTARDVPHTKPARRAIVRVVEVAPGTLQVRILEHSTRKPVANRKVALWRRGKPNVMVAKRSTGVDGTCHVPARDTGEYLLDLGGHNQLNLRVARTASIKALDIVLPAQQKLAKPRVPAKAQAAAASAGISTVGWALIGVGVAAAIAIPIAIANNSDNSTNRVSPTSRGPAKFRGPRLPRNHLFSAPPLLTPSSSQTGRTVRG